MHPKNAAFVTAVAASLATVALPQPVRAQSRFESMDVFQLEYAADPRISPDGSKVVYVRTSMDIMRDRKRSELWIVNADGSDRRRLSVGSSPRWSPDGTRIAYMADGQIHLRWMDSGETAALTQVTESQAGSDGRRQVAFVGYEDRTRTYQFRRLQVIDLDGGGQRVITGGLDRSVSSPLWAADGSGVYFQYDDEGNSKVGFATPNGEIEVLAEDLGGTSYGRPYGGGSFSVANNGAFALNQTRPDMPGELAVGVHGGAAARTITPLNGDLLAGKTLGEVEELWWESSYDDRPVHGWIVKPPDFDSSR